MEVLYDLDTEARQYCETIGLNMIRAATVGTHPSFIRMIRELILERMDTETTRRSLGTSGPSHDVCPVDCCLPGAEMPGRPRSDRALKEVNHSSKGGSRSPSGDLPC